MAKRFEQRGFSSHADDIRRVVEKWKDQGSAPETLSPIFVWIKDQLTGEPSYLHDRFTFWPEKDIVERFDGQEVTLNNRVSNLLKVLVEKPNRVQSKAEILQKAWGNFNYSEKTIRWHVSELRKIIESDSHKPEIIITVPSRGYFLKDQNKASRQEGLLDTEPEEIVSYPGLEYHPEFGLVIIDGNRNIELTPTENKILRLLARNPERVIKESNLEELWHNKDSSNGKVYIRTYIKTLRQKIGRNWIINKRGQGYQFAVPAKNF